MPKIKAFEYDSEEIEGEEQNDSSDNKLNEEDSEVKPAKKIVKKEVLDDKPKSNLQIIRENEEHTRKVLNAQAKINFFVPLEPGEEKGAYDLVSINGVEYKVFKGTENIIPKAVANVLKNKYNISQETANYQRAENIKELEE